MQGKVDSCKLEANIIYKNLIINFLYYISMQKQIYIKKNEACSDGYEE